MTVRAFFLIFIICFVFASPSQACTSPTGAEGDVIFNTTYNTPQYCNGQYWVPFGMLNPAAGGSGCGNPSGIAGDLLYNNTYHVLQYCDGDDWRSVGSAISPEQSGPADCVNVGDVCADTTIFAGWHPRTRVQLFIPATDQGTTSAWKTSVGANDIATDSVINGQDNTSQVPNSATFPAFKLCKDLSTGGYTDWYLPSQVEMYYIWVMRGAIEAAGNITNFQNSSYWTSTEYDNSSGWITGLSLGTQLNSNKTLTYRVRCMRRR